MKLIQERETMDQYLIRFTHNKNKVCVSPEGWFLCGSITAKGPSLFQKTSFPAPQPRQDHGIIFLDITHYNHLATRVSHRHRDSSEHVSCECHRAENYYFCLVCAQLLDLWAVGVI